MNDDEVINIFLSAIFVIGIQFMVTILIVNYMQVNPQFQEVSAKSYLIIIARFFAYNMMHLNLEPEIRNGLIILKHCVNHPEIFKNAVYSNEDGKK